MKEDAQFYVGQKAFIHKDGKILILKDAKRSRMPFDYPGGKIQEGEKDLAESLKREVYEETGLEIDVGAAFATCHTTLPPGHRLGGKHLFLVGYKCEYIFGDIKLSDEHTSFQWIDRDEHKALDDGTPFYRMMEKYFEDAKEE